MMTILIQRAWLIVWLLSVPLLQGAFPLGDLGFPGLSSTAGGGAPGSAHTRPSLWLDQETVVPGSTLMAVVELDHDPDWHTYWKNPGVGIPTRLEWKLPEGWQAGEILWPVPKKLSSAGVTSYYLEGKAWLLVPIQVPASAAVGEQALQVVVSWQECNDQTCLPPSDKELQAKVLVGPESKPSSLQEAILAWKEHRIPKRRDPSLVEVGWDGPSEGSSRGMVMLWKRGQAAPAPEFFPEAMEGFELEVETASSFEASSGTQVLRLSLARLNPERDWPAQLVGVLSTDAAHPEMAEAIIVEAPLSGSLSPATVESKAAVGGNNGSPGNWWVALLSAFLGGIILNVMPCVLPVISLKILSFVHQGQQTGGSALRLGLFYTLGVLVSFAALAGLVIAVQAAGRVASWGMQFSNPVFLVSLLVVVVLVSLNLFGVFEITLTGAAAGAAGGLASRKGALGAFFNGLLATTLATPCTAPFLAPALGFAFAQSPLTILLFFLMAGAGLAFPYLLLSMNPQWLRWMPKPGTWMVRFKVLMGFPMLATAVWIFWLAEQRLGNGAGLWLGLFLVLLSLAAWIWGEFGQRGGGRIKALVVVGLLLAASYGYLLEGKLAWRKVREFRKAGAEASLDAGGIAWKTWSPRAVEEARQAGHPVLVDFTADWCWTCQLNEKSSLEIESVRQKLKEIGGVALVADNTDNPPEIAEEIRRHGRAGVPLVLVYSANPASDPQVLPALLTPSIVLEALDRAAQ